MKCILSDESCPLIHAKAQTVSFVKNQTTVHICPRCHSILADMDFYHDQYEDTKYYTMKHESLADIETEWGFRWRYILEKIVRLNGKGSLLDIGAGNGYFVNLARMEFNLEAEGSEISQAEIDYAHRHFNLALIRDFQAIPHDFDILTSFNVLEHVTDPTEFLKTMLTKLKPGGLFIISTPNPGCIKARVKGVREWNIVCPPHHINLFSRSALTALLLQNHISPILYETLSTYVKPIARLDTKSQVLRRTVFQMLKLLRLGGDHFMVGRKGK